MQFDDVNRPSLSAQNPHDPAFVSRFTRPEYYRRFQVDDVTYLPPRGTRCRTSLVFSYRGGPFVALRDYRGTLLLATCAATKMPKTHSAGVNSDIHGVSKRSTFGDKAVSPE